jgi:hypothetical protein
MVDNNNWDDEHNTYLMGLWLIGNREDALYVFDKMCVCPVLVLAYCSDHNVAVHLHFVGMHVFFKGLTKLGGAKKLGMHGEGILFSDSPMPSSPGN